MPVTKTLLNSRGTLRWFRNSWELRTRKLFCGDEILSVARGGGGISFLGPKMDS